VESVLHRVGMLVQWDNVASLNGSQLAYMSGYPRVSVAGVGERDQSFTCSRFRTVSSRQSIESHCGTRLPKPNPSPPREEGCAESRTTLAFRPSVNRLYLFAITTRSRHLPLPQIEPPFGLFESVLKLRELGHHTLHNTPIPHPCASRSLSVAHPRNHWPSTNFLHSINICVSQITRGRGRKVGKAWAYRSPEDSGL
jgi:hypothetical protein